MLLLTIYIYILREMFIDTYVHLVVSLFVSVNLVLFFFQTTEYFILYGKKKRTKFTDLGFCTSGICRQGLILFVVEVQMRELDYLV